MTTHRRHPLMFDIFRAGQPGRGYYLYTYPDHRAGSIPANSSKLDISLRVEVNFFESWRQSSLSL